MASPAPSTSCPACGQSFARTVKICPNDGTVLEHEATVATEVGRTLDGKYRLDAFLSHGGMGAVYRATHIMLGKTVAVKLINPDLVTSADVVRRFQREARAANALNHPNIAAVYDLGQTPEGTLYIAMEFVDGPTLKAAIEKGGGMAPARVVSILRQVSSALAVAHRNNIVHRDLKPHNIMLSRTDDGREVAKLVDFGIAKTFDETTQLTATGFALGTPQYMAPEQAEGRPVDGRTDLYSLGVILYEMLSGEVPFNDTSASAILLKHMKEAPVPPSVKNPSAHVPPALETVALRCLEKDPAKRYQTADEFAAALDRAAADIPDLVASMQPTVRMAAAGSPAAPPPAPPPASNVEPAPHPADTRPTTPAVAAMDQQSSSPPKSGAPVLVAVLVLLAVAAAGAGFYVRQQRAAAPTAAATPEPPAATPAMAQTPPPEAPPQQSPQDHGSARTPTKPVTPAASQGSAGRTPAGGRQPSSYGRAASSGSAGASGHEAANAAQEAPPAFPSAPAVFFHCSGIPEICSTLRAQVDEALGKAGLASVRNAGRADVDVAARVEGVQEKVDQQFKTTFAVRTFSIDVTAETTHTGEAVSMPAPATLSYDPQFGAERVVEKARLVAGDIVDKITAFARKKNGG